MLNKDTKVLFVSTNQMNEDDFTNFSQRVDVFSKISGYSAIIYNNAKPHTELELKDWYEMKKNVDFTKEVDEHKVIILSINGFTNEDATKVSEIIRKSLLQYEIKISFLNEEIKLNTLEDFFEKVESDIGILNKIKSKPVIDISEEEDLVRYYRGKYRVERIGSVKSDKKAPFLALEDGDTFKKDDKIILPVNQCWRMKK